jgi:hypothetical protein
MPPLELDEELEELEDELLDDEPVDELEEELELDELEDELEPELLEDDPPLPPPPQAVSPMTVTTNTNLLRIFISRPLAIYE